MLGTQGVGCPYLLATQPLLRRLLQESKHEVQELLAQVRPLRQARPQAPLSACAGGTAPAKYFLNFFGDLKRGSPPPTWGLGQMGTPEVYNQKWFRLSSPSKRWVGGCGPQVFKKMSQLLAPSSQLPAWSNRPFPCPCQAEYGPP